MLDQVKRDYPDLVESLDRERQTEISRLRAEVERLTALESLHAKRETARRLLREFDLPEADAVEPWAKAITSPVFFESLLTASDEPAMRALVEERARLVRTLSGDEAPTPREAVRPCCRDQHLVGAAGAIDGKSFVEAIT
jgi:hypothetical protein